jgi:hypothetical protein
MTPSCSRGVSAAPRLPTGSGARELALTRSVRPTGKARRNKGLTHHGANGAGRERNVGRLSTFLERLPLSLGISQPLAGD